MKIIFTKSFHAGVDKTFSVALELLLLCCFQFHLELLFFAVDRLLFCESFQFIFRKTKHSTTLLSFNVMPPVLKDGP